MRLFNRIYRWMGRRKHKPCGPDFLCETCITGDPELDKLILGSRRVRRENIGIVDLTFRTSLGEAVNWHPIEIGELHEKIVHDSSPSVD